jgi:hypothetical protein
MAKIVGPNSLEGCLAQRKGFPVPEMPKESNICVKAEKSNGEIQSKC